MTVDEVARRLDVSPARVSRVREHPAGHLAQVRDRGTMLVTDTVARRYVPEVDDEAAARPRARRSGKAS